MLHTGLENMSMMYHHIKFHFPAISFLQVTAFKS